MSYFTNLLSLFVRDFWHKWPRNIVLNCYKLGLRTMGVKFIFEKSPVAQSDLLQYLCSALQTKQNLIPAQTLNL